MNESLKKIQDAVDNLNATFREVGQVERLEYDIHHSVGAIGNERAYPTLQVKVVLPLMHTVTERQR